MSGEFVRDQIASRRIALLTNPTSGKGRGLEYARRALPRLREAGFEVSVLTGTDSDESLDLARRAVDNGVGTLAVCGGDGMVHVGIQAAARTPTRLGIIPAGTGNDVARYLGVPRGNPEAAADVVVGSRTRRFDLARVGGTYYATVLAAGFDAVVNERANKMSWPRGQMRYNLATLAELRVLRPIPYILELNGPAGRRTLRTDATLVAVGNGPSFGGGLRIAEGARIDDGLLDLVLVHPVSRPELLRLYPRLFKGTHINHPTFERHLVTSVTVAAPGIVAYADGERLAPLPLTIEVCPGAVEVLSP